MRCDVLIIGAGPTGLVLALWLARMGVSVRIVSKAEGPGTASRALAVHARTLEFYEQIDLAKAIVADGYKVDGVNLWVGGEKQAHVSLSGAGESHTRYPFLHIFPQDRHEKLLVSRLEAAGVTIDWNTTFSGYVETASGIVARLLTAAGDEISCEAGYLAGCDGASSAVRKAIGANFPGGTYQQTFYVADVEAAGPPMNGELNIALDSADFLAIFPLDAGKRARLIGTVEEAADRTGSLTFEELNDKAIKHLRIEVGAVNWFSTYRVHHRVTEQFRKGRVFLLGDAAHIHSPAGGQGMNTGIGDAVNLAWKLHMVLSNRATDRILDSYEEERIAFARKLVQTTDQAFSLATSEGRLARWVRTRLVPVVLPAAIRIDAVRDFMFRTVSQLTINYRGDALSDGKAGEIHGGDRLPWIEFGNGRSNYDGFRAMRWELHVYGDARADVKTWCDKNGVLSRVYQWSDACAREGLSQGAVYLVRPDCHVAFAGRDASTEALDAYFDERAITRPLC